MDKKINFNYINKKIVSGALILTLLTTPLAGCSNPEYNGFEYSVHESGEYEANGKIDYSLLRFYKFIVIENEKYDKIEFYICSARTAMGYGMSSTRYIDVFTNQDVFTDNSSIDSRKIIFSDDVENYLYATENIKANYTNDDLKNILEQFKENYLKQNNKQLVKGK